MKRLGLVSLIALAWADAAAAQNVAPTVSEFGGPARAAAAGPRVAFAPIPPAATEIDPDVAPERSLNTSVVQVANVYTIDGGTRVGNNLFHSFAQFDLAAGDIARWVHTTGDPNTVANVVNRVTGGTASQLFGTLDSTSIPNADFYFINPAGIVFGATAQVDVPAAAHFSTASELRFASGPAFAVATPNGSTLNVAAPQAFGFIGNEGAILVSGVDQNFLPGAGELSLTAGDVGIEDSVFDTGELVVAAAGATAAEVFTDGTTSAPLGGLLQATNSSIISFPGGGFGGSVTLAAGDLVMDGAQFSSQSGSSNPAGAVTVTAGTATLLNGSTISSNSNTSFSGGLVTLSVDGLLSLAGNSTIDSDAFSDGQGGDVLIFADDIDLATGSKITSNSFGAGDGGAITIDVAGSLTVSGNAFISSDTFGTGTGGGVSINAGSVDVDFGYISSDGVGDGDAGAVILNVTGLLSVRNGGYISSDTYGAGLANGVIANAGSVTLTGGGRISSDALGSGDGGLVGVETPGLLTMDNGQIRANSQGSGAAAGVIVRAGEARLTNGSLITSDAQGDGDGGVVLAEIAGDLSLSNNSVISADTMGAGSGLGVLVSAANLDVRSGSRISSNANSDGNSGIVIADIAGLLTLDGNASISSDSFGVGDAGGVFLTAGDAELASGSFISSDALGSGNGGLVTVQVIGRLGLDLGSYISSDVDGSGDAGNVFVLAGEIDLANFSYISSDTLFNSSGNAGNVSVTGALVSLSNSSISSDALGVGDAGSVTVSAGFLTVTDTSYISSDAVGDGNAGVVDVAVDQLLTLGSGSYISSDVYGAGFAGDVFVTADRLSITDASTIRSNVQTSSALGDAGNVFVSVRALDMARSGAISSDSFGFGDAGNVTVEAASASLRDGSYISSDALGDGFGGFVDVAVTGTLGLDNGSYISSDVLGAGDGGDVFVTANRIDLARSSYISSNTFPSSIGDAGNVTVETATLNMTDSFIASDALGDGDAGFVDVTATNLAMNASYISSDSGGLGNGGNVLVAVQNGRLSNGSSISSNALAFGDAGDVFVTGGSVTLEASFIASNANSVGDAGNVDITLQSLTLINDSAVTSEAAFSGDSGNIFIDVAGALALDSSRIGTNSRGDGDAGNVLITAGTITLEDESQIASAAEAGSTGLSGFVSLGADEIAVLSGSAVSTSSANPNPAGEIRIVANRVTVSGTNGQTGAARLASRISSANEFDGACGAAACAAGLITITTSGPDAEGIFLRDGGTITTSSLQGPAGNIDLVMSPNTLLILEGRTDPGVIETSSGPGTGGVIRISRPLAIVSNGGRISALGQSGGANVLIDTPFFIASADRINIVEVEGVLEFSNAISDVSAGTVNPDLTVLDASSVLRGQCSAPRSSGAVSQFSVREIGPYAPQATAAPPPDAAGGAPVTGDCL